MAAFAQLLPRAQAVYLPNPVVDLTGLQGTWDFEVSFTARPLLAQAGSDGISLFDALEKQLGLKLELKDMPTSTLVVDSVERKPTANSPDVAKVLPPAPPPEFEVATIKPTSPDQKGANARIQPTGMVNVVGLPLKQLIQLAWNLQSDELLDIPKWTETARFDLVARAFASTTNTDQPPIEIDTLRQMLRTFLTERFQMKTHVENREVSGYVLSASFNGAGDTMTPTLINILCLWLGELPLAYLLATSAGFGPAGVFWAIAIAFSAMSFVSAAVFRRGKWKNKKV